jgi:hypothetical protein
LNLKLQTSNLKLHTPGGIYSYGDSAGFAPDFPFNTARAVTKYAAKVKEGNGMAK